METIKTLKSELEAAQKDLEMRAIRDDGQCDLIANLRQQLADKTRECEEEKNNYLAMKQRAVELRAENAELKKSICGTPRPKKITKLQAALNKTRKEANNWTPEYRAELLKKGLAIIEHGTPRPTTKKGKEE